MSRAGVRISPGPPVSDANVTQLVECRPSKSVVVGSSPIIRSSFSVTVPRFEKKPREGRGPGLGQARMHRKSCRSWSLCTGGAIAVKQQRDRPKGRDSL